VISSYDNLLETINFRKRQDKLTKQCSRFDKSVESDEWKPGGKKGGFLGEGEDEEEDGYGIVNKHELVDEDDEDDTFSIFGSGTTRNDHAPTRLSRTYMMC
jgi:hypothetical protein